MRTMVFALAALVALVAATIASPLQGPAAGAHEEVATRVVAPAHVDYGEVEKVYERMGARAEAVRGFWRDHLDGKLTSEAALDGIVASFTPAPK